MVISANEKENQTREQGIWLGVGALVAHLTWYWRKIWLDRGNNSEMPLTGSSEQWGVRQETISELYLQGPKALYLFGL